MDVSSARRFVFGVLNCGQLLSELNLIIVFSQFQMPCSVSWVDNTLNKSFFKLGKFIAKSPGYFIIVPILLALLCMTG